MGSTTSFIRSAIAAALGPIAPAGLLMAFTTFLVVSDLLEGRYALPPPPALKDLEAKENIVGKDDVGLSHKPSPMSWRQKLMLFALFRRSKFEYVVGAKPV